MGSDKRIALSREASSDGNFWCLQSIANFRLSKNRRSWLASEAPPLGITLVILLCDLSHLLILFMGVTAWYPSEAVSDLSWCENIYHVGVWRLRQTENYNYGINISGDQIGKRSAATRDNFSYPYMWFITFIIYLYGGPFWTPVINLPMPLYLVLGCLSDCQTRSPFE